MHAELATSAPRTSTSSPLVISGMGAVSALGHGTEVLWRAMRDGRDGIRRIRRFETTSFRVELAATVPRYERAEASEALTVELARQAGAEALAEARLDAAATRRVALVLGTSVGDFSTPLDRIARALSEALELSGLSLTVSTACASSTNAIGLARDLIGRGDAECVLAGGVDLLTPEIFAGFHALGVLSPNKCAPFSFPTGTTLGEGAGFVVLESVQRARARGARAVAVLQGYGIAADAYHETSPDPRGGGAARALRAALLDAGVPAQRIDYVNLHGTGTQANDPAEWHGVRCALGERADEIPASSSKSFLGHAQGAAGVLELIASLLALRHGCVPPTRNVVERRPRCPNDPVAGPRPRPAEVRCFAVLNAAFGGANAALVLGAAPSEADAVSTVGAPSSRARALAAQLRPAAHRCEPLRLLSASAVGCFGDERALDALLADLFAAEVTNEGVSDARRVGSRSVRERPMPAVCRRVDPRSLDPAARLLLEATARALEQGTGVPRGASRARVGLVAATTRVSARSARRFFDSIERNGLAKLSAVAFARMVLNAATGSSCAVLGLRGPTSTLTVGEGSGLVALCYAAELLSRQPQLDAMLAGAVDELADFELSDAKVAPPDSSVVGPRAVSNEGAACLMLSRPDSGAGVGRANGDDVRCAASATAWLTGWAVAPRLEMQRAARRASARAGLRAEQVDLVIHCDASSGPLSWPSTTRQRALPAALVGAPATTALWACALAGAAMRSGRARRVLVCGDGGSASSAALFDWRQDHELQR